MIVAEIGAEFLFQVIAERAERSALLLTTNLPFSEWTKVIPNARLCKALLDRITDDEPGKTQESRDLRVLSARQIRESVLRGPDGTPSQKRDVEGALACDLVTRTPRPTTCPTPFARLTLTMA